MREVCLRRNSDENEGIEKMARIPNFKVIGSAARRLGTDANGLSAVQGWSTRVTFYRWMLAATALECAKCFCVGIPVNTKMIEK